MAYRNDAPTIPLDKIQWDEIGEDDPKHRLLAHIRIGNLDMHLEAWEIDLSAKEQQDTFERCDDFGCLIDMMDTAFQTVEINGRDYFLIATPYGD